MFPGSFSEASEKLPEASEKLPEDSGKLPEDFKNLPGIFGRNLPASRPCTPPRTEGPTGALERTVQGGPEAPLAGGEGPPAAGEPPSIRCKILEASVSCSANKFKVN